MGLFAEKCELATTSDDDEPGDDVEHKSKYEKYIKISVCPRKEWVTVEADNEKDEPRRQDIYLLVEVMDCRHSARTRLAEFRRSLLTKCESSQIAF